MVESNIRSLPTPLQQAGVTASATETAVLSLRELPDMTVLRLHSLENATELASALAQSDVVLPTEINSATGQSPAVMCLRPGEWLLLDGGTSPQDLLDRIAPRVDPALTALLDLSDSLGVYRLAGAASPWLLAKLSGLDFLSGVSTGQHAARTRVADIAVVLHFHPTPDGSPRFDLVFDRSVAKYLWELLNDAAPHAEELFTAHGAGT